MIGAGHWAALSLDLVDENTAEAAQGDLTSRDGAAAGLAAVSRSKLGRYGEFYYARRQRQARPKVPLQTLTRFDFDSMSSSLIVKCFRAARTCSRVL